MLSQVTSTELETVFRVGTTGRSGVSFPREVHRILRPVGLVEYDGGWRGHTETRTIVTKPTEESGPKTD